MSKDKNKQELVSANIKITKGQVPLARELGITHANFRNKGLNKRLRKEQKELDKRQQRNANKRKLLDNYLQAKKAIETETARHQQAEKEYDSVAERVMSVSPQPGPHEVVPGFSAAVESRTLYTPTAHTVLTDTSPRETVEQAAKRVMGILGFGDQSEAASLESTHEACLDIKAARKIDDEETGIDPTLPFDDGTVDTNVDPKNFGVQSVDNDAEEANRVTGKHTHASDLAFRETTKGFYDGCTEIDSELDNLLEVLISSGRFVDVRASDNSVIIRDPETGWVSKLPAHMVNGNKLRHMVDVTKLGEIAKYLPSDLAVLIMAKYERAIADGVTQIETPQELFDYWSSRIGDDEVTRMYPDGHQDWKWDGLKKKIAEQGGIPNVTIMAELPTNEPTGRGFPPIPSEPGCTEVTLMYPGMDSLAGLNPFGGTCGGNRRQMYGNSEGQQPRALAKREFFDKHASEATPEDISQVFPHHPDHQLDPMLVEAAEMAAEALGLHDEGFTTKVLDDMIIMTPLQKPKDDSSDKE